MIPNATQVKSGARWLIGLGAGTVIGVWLKNHGFPLDDNALEVFSATVSAAFMLVWSGFVHTDSATVQRAASIVPIPAATQIAAGVTNPSPQYAAKNQVNDFGAIAIIVLIIGSLTAAGFGGVILNKKLNSVKTLATALTVYDGLIIGADVYVTECAEHVIDQSCVPLAQRIFAEAEKTKAAYLVVKGYGASPPTDAAAALIAAVNVLQAYFVQQ